MKRNDNECEESKFIAENILKVAPIGIGLIREHVLRIVSDSFCKMMGYSRAGLVGKNVKILYPSGSEFERVDREESRQIEKRGTAMLETTLRRKDGSLIDVMFNAAAIDKSDVSQGTIFIVSDISDRKRAEEALRENESKYKMLLETSPDLVYRVGPEGEILDCNETAVNTLKYSKRELLGKPFLDIYAEESIKDAKKFFKEWLRDGKLRNKELRVVTKDGEKIDVELNVNTIYDENGEVVSSVSVQRDITERRGVEAMKRGLIHADRLMVIGQLAAGIAHEINNPAAFVMANISNLRKNIKDLEELYYSLQVSFDYEGEEKLRESIRSILAKNNLPNIVTESEEILKESMEGMNRIRSIVRDLRVFSRVEEEEFEKTQVNEVVNIAVNMTYNEIRHKARLEKDLGKVPLFFTDKAKLVQVLVNLLLNAAQAITANSIEDNKVRLTTRSDGKDVFFIVEDTGCGIPGDIIHRIYDPFFTTKPRESGTGLGLTLCADIVHKLGGEIGVKSKVGEGARFEVKIPIVKDSIAKAKGKSKSDLSTGERKGKILIIDDEELLLKAYKRGLEHEHSVVTAKSGEEAIKILEKDSSFDVVLCDMVMPGMNGVEVYKALKKKMPKVIGKVIFCSGSGFGTHLKQLGDSVENICLEKPISMKILKQTIQDMMIKPS